MVSSVNPIGNDNLGLYGLIRKIDHSDPRIKALAITVFTAVAVTSAFLGYSLSISFGASLIMTSFVAFLAYKISNYVLQSKLANLIQACEHGRQERAKFLNLKAEKTKAIKLVEANLAKQIQACTRGLHERKTLANQKAEKAKAINILEKAILYNNAAIVAQRFWRRSKLTPLAKKEDRFLTSFQSIRTHDQIRCNFKPTGKTLGAGGNGIVVEAMESRTQKPVAIKINLKAYPDYMTKVYARIQHAREKMPHLTEIRAVYQGVYYYNSASHNELYSFNPKEVLFHHECKPAYGTCERRRMINMVTVMEKMEGDLDGLPEMKNNGIQRTCIELQAFFAKAQLGAFGLALADYKTRNILYKTLTSDDIFQGKKMIDYDYWKYRFQGLDYYIPRPRVLIKFADYDEWTILDNNPSQDGLDLSHVNRDHLNQLRRKPEGAVSILDMGGV